MAIYVARGVLLFGLCLLILRPLVAQLSISFMSTSDLFNPAVNLIPRRPTMGMYRMAIYLMNYWESLVRTLAITFSASFLQIAACALAAYGFARFNFPLKRFWFICVMLTILVPPQVIMAPMFMNFRFFTFFGLTNLVGVESMNKLNIYGYLIMVATGMGLRSGLFIFVMRQYMRSMPMELEEAAYVDGCGKLRTFFQIALRDTIPMLVTCFLLAFVWQWTDGFYSNMFLWEQGVMSLQMSGLAEVYRNWFISTGWIPVNELRQLIAIGVLIGTVPVIAIYVLAQRMLEKCIGQSGLKM